jgi:hypothetical protein
MAKAPFAADCTMFEGTAAARISSIMRDMGWTSSARSWASDCS